MTDTQLAILLDHIVVDISRARCEILNALGKHRNDEITICDLGDIINKELLAVIERQERHMHFLGISKGVTAHGVAGPRGFLGPFDGLEKLLEDNPDYNVDGFEAALNELLKGTGRDD